MCGLRSRCRTPASCAWGSPRATSPAIASASATGQRPALDAARQRLPAQMLEDEIGRAVPLAPVVDGDDVRMVEPRGGPRLGLEAPPPLLAEGAAPADGDELDGHVAFEVEIAGEEDRAEAALAEPAHDLEAAGDALTGARARRRLTRPPGRALAVERSRQRVGDLAQEHLVG